MKDTDLIIFVIVGVLILLVFVWGFWSVKKTPSDGYIKYCFDEAKKCKEQGDEYGEKKWLLEAIKAACYTF